MASARALFILALCTSTVVPCAGRRSQQAGQIIASQQAQADAEATDALSTTGPNELQLSMAKWDAAYHHGKMKKAEFVAGCVAFAAFLNKISPQIGKYVADLTDKVKSSPIANAKENDYYAYLLSEVSEQSQRSTDGNYLDKSACSGNEWLSYVLDFAISMLDKVGDGLETQAAASTAFKGTLGPHLSAKHKFLFSAGLKTFPGRAKFMAVVKERDQGPPLSDEQAATAMKTFAQHARPLVAYMGKLHKQIQQKLAVEYSRVRTHQGGDLHDPEPHPDGDEEEVTEGRRARLMRVGRRAGMHLVNYGKAWLYGEESTTTTEPPKPAQPEGWIERALGGRDNMQEIMDRGGEMDE